MSWRWECSDHGNWISNAVRFKTKKEAAAYGVDLTFRWTAMPIPARAARSKDPVTHHWNSATRTLTDVKTNAGYVPPFRISL